LENWKGRIDTRFEGSHLRFEGILRIEFFGKGNFISPYKEKSIIPKRRAWRGCKSFYFKADFILYMTDFVLYEADFILYETDFILYETDFILYETDFILYMTDFILYEAEIMLYEADFIVYFGECGFFGDMNQ
jgi:hypothetical protein